MEDEHKCSNTNQSCYKYVRLRGKKEEEKEKEKKALLEIVGEGWVLGMSVGTGHEMLLLGWTSYGLGWVTLLSRLVGADIDHVKWLKMNLMLLV